MINDLYILSQSLEACGINVPSRHPSLQQPPHKRGLVIGLDSSGHPTAAWSLSPDQLAQCWTQGEGNHSRFPLLQIKPAWTLPTTDPIWTTLQSLPAAEDRLDLIWTRCANVPCKEIYRWSSLRKRVATRLDQLVDLQPQFLSLPTLYQRFLLSTEVSSDFLYQLVAMTRARFLAGDDLDPQLLEHLWLGKKEGASTKTALVLDVADPHAFSFPVRHPEIASYVNHCLHQVASTLPANTGSCALTGTTISLAEGKWPNPVLPIVGMSYLFSVNNQVPCQQRYGRTGSGTFPVSSHLPQRLQDALIYLTHPERYGHTWYPVAGQRPKTSDLLIAYLADKPDAALHIVGLFADVDDEAQQSSFDIHSSTVFAALTEMSIHPIDALVRVLIVRAVDPGRRQIVLHETATVTHLQRCIDAWKAAATNYFPTPRFYPRKRCPAPFATQRILQTHWFHDGMASKTVSGQPIPSLYALFLGTESQQRHAARPLLSTLLQRTTALLIGYGTVQGLRAETPYERARLRTYRHYHAVHSTLVFLGILLYKMDLKKEQYMQSPFFYLGRMLRLADQLHLEYCRRRRKGSIPARLLGNALLPTMLQQPAKGLARLGERLRVYQAWATTDSSEHARLAKWLLGRLGDVTLHLSNQPIPTRATEVDRAQLLLGYLAHIPSDKPQPTDDSPEEHTL